MKLVQQLSMEAYAYIFAIARLSSEHASFLAHRILFLRSYQL